MIQKLFALLLGNKSDRDLKEIQPYVDRILAVEPSVQALDNDGLRAKTQEFRARLERVQSEERSAIADLRARAESEEDADEKNVLFQQIDELDKKAYDKAEAELAEILPEAFAVIRETAKRLSAGNFRVRATEMDRQLAGRMDAVQIDGDHAVWHNTWTAAGATVEWNMVHYNVQLIGGTVLHLGRIAEMATGEGKTLVATLPVYLNALTGFGVHVVTVNDYLAKRDAEWMGPLYQFHGLTVDCIDKHQPNSDARRNAYGSDITFGTNNEFGFDYLRDNMARFPEELVQRGHNFAIVDEVDSVLIDDARTPLIISGPTPNGDRHEFNELKPHVVDLYNAQKTIAQEALNNAKRLLTEGNNKEAGFQLLRAHRGLPKNKALIKFLSEDGNKTLLQKTENFYLQDHGREMKVVDEALYFTIEEKNNQVQLTDRGMERLADRTNPAFFVMPDISTSLAAIEKSNETTADKAEQKSELLREYRVKSERVHTMSQLLKAYTLFEKDQEYVLMDGKVKIVDEQTGRIMEGRRYSDGLHQAIESKENVTIEAATQTYATVTLQNYFRMYRKLAGMTGTAETEAGEFWEIYKLDVTVIPTNRPISRTDHDDLVYKTKREKYNAAIDEIVKLRDAGRPVLVGTTSVEISELLSRALKLRNIPHNVLNAKLHQREAEIVAEAGRAGAVTIATNMAGRGTDIKLAPEAKAAGGLAIIGTERHDSRRVDRQLRGRAGRQGDPGSSQFFVSLEDNLMRLFGSDRIAGLMDRMGHVEGEVIQHGLVSKSIERAQKKVEENNFGIRKRLLDYDNVMNAQREGIYKRRRNALYGERLQVDIANMLYDLCDTVVRSTHPDRNFEGFALEVYEQLGISELPFDAASFAKSSASELAQKLFDHTSIDIKEKNDSMATRMAPVLEGIHRDHNGQIQNILVPFADGEKGLQVSVPLQKAVDTRGQSALRELEKVIVLSTIDDAWKEHLRNMDDLRTNVQGAVYEQKDPLLIYKHESFKLFQDMMDQVNRSAVSFLFRAYIPEEAPQAAPAQRPAAPRPLTTASRSLVSETTSTTAGPSSAAKNTPPPRPAQAPVVKQKSTHRPNDTVTVANLLTGEQRTLKFKAAEPLLNQGWMLLESSGS
jgi:preprotein translocase subunit SecA